jgi:hypothetical protein
MGSSHTPPESNVIDRREGQLFNQRSTRLESGSESVEVKDAKGVEGLSFSERS